jgi:hypothetical protein
MPQPQLPSQPPAIQPLSLTSRVGAIKSSQLVNLLQILENEVILICRLSKFTKLQAIWDFTITIACKFAPF